MRHFCTKCPFKLILQTNYISKHIFFILKFIKQALCYNYFMKKFLISLILSVFICNIGFSMISPTVRQDIINQSEIKTPAIVRSVKTIHNRKGNRTQLVVLEGLYNNSDKKYEAQCHNFKSIFPWDTPLVGGDVNYSPKKGQRVFVTIDRPNGKITSMTVMDKEFENKLQSVPQKLKFNYNGAYFED